MACTSPRNPLITGCELMSAEVSRRMSVMHCCVNERKSAPQTPPRYSSPSNAFGWRMPSRRGLSNRTLFRLMWQLVLSRLHSEFDLA